jgi:MoxR-like ATPase/DNA invertase Pin-like site-specific DNA recombinase
MESHIRSGHISGLIFSKLARLARNTKDLLEFADFFREHDADLISLAESIDTSSPAGRLFYTMIAALAQWEREEISARVTAAVPIRAKMGKILGGRVPYGYQKQDGKLAPDPNEAPVRKLIFELYKKMGRKMAVARELNERGYRTRTGDQFTDSAIQRLISDPIAKGTRRVNYTRSTEKRGVELKPQDEWIMQAVEPIVTEELWAECNSILNSVKEKGKWKPKRAKHLFAGLTYCGCGTKMYVFTTSAGKYLCEACRNKIPGADLEAVFHEQLKNFFFSPDEIARHLEATHETVRTKDELLTTLQGERVKHDQAIEKLHALYQSGAIDPSGFGAKYHPLADRQRQLDDEIPTVQAELDFLRISELSKAEIVSSAQDLYTRWPSLPFEERRTIVETITERIVISEGEVEINLFYAPPMHPGPSGGAGGTQSGFGGDSTPSSSSPAGNRNKRLAIGCGFASPRGRFSRTTRFQRCAARIAGGAASGFPRSTYHISDTSDGTRAPSLDTCSTSKRKRTPRSVACGKPDTIPVIAMSRPSHSAANASASRASARSAAMPYPRSAPETSDSSAAANRDRPPASRAPSSAATPASATGTSGSADSRCSQQVPRRKAIAKRRTVESRTHARAHALTGGRTAMTEPTKLLRDLDANLGRVILGRPRALRWLLAAFASGGHVLLEDMPGTGKTTLANALAFSLTAGFKRVQFTADLLPSDIIGMSTFDPRDQSFHFHDGPVFCNILLADEINRASPRTQSALLEAMAEGQVTAEGMRRALPDPFFVVATQNPVESTGTYPLPEAQLDRFAVRFGLGYVEPEDEVAMLAAQVVSHPLHALQPVGTLEDVVQLRKAVAGVRIGDAVRRYIVDIVAGTRHRKTIRLGASPRASIALQRLTQALALMDGEAFVTPDHVREIAVPALAHRITVESQAQFSGRTSNDVVAEALDEIALPA